MGGLYGKLPAHGDFIRRGLTAETGKRLHDWLQTGLATLPAQDRDERMQGAPCWRFAAPAGLLAEAPVAGVVAPSRDQVGRIYPLVAFLSLAGQDLAAALVDGAWAAGLEGLIGEAAQAPLDADQLLAAMHRLDPPGAWRGELGPRSTRLGGALRVDVAAQDALLLALAAGTPAGPDASGKSLWWSLTDAGAVLLCVDGLPVDEVFESLFGDPQAPGSAPSRELRLCNT